VFDNSGTKIPNVIALHSDRTPSYVFYKVTALSKMANYDMSRAFMESIRPRNLVHLSRDDNALCLLCRGINVQSLSRVGGYQHVLNPADMIESAKTCPLCERFILRPEGISQGMEHQAATGPISCSLDGLPGFKRLVLKTASWISEPGQMRTGELLNIPVFTDAGKRPTSHVVK
jgi:hypothetical protein